MNIRKLKHRTKNVIRLVFLLAAANGGANAVFAVDFPEPGDVAAGGLAWVENCTHCHNLRNPNELRDDQWITSMFHMRLKAGLTGKETRDILSFIQAANATASQVRIREDAQTNSTIQPSEAEAQK